MMIEIPDYIFERILRDLKRSIDVCYNVDYTSESTEQSPSYAVGYSRSAMQSVIEDLKNLKKINN